MCYDAISQWLCRNTYVAQSSSSTWCLRGSDNPTKMFWAWLLVIQHWSTHWKLCTTVIPPSTTVCLIQHKMDIKVAMHVCFKVQFFQALSQLWRFALAQIFKQSKSCLDHNFWRKFFKFVTIVRLCHWCNQVKRWSWRRSLHLWCRPQILKTRWCTLHRQKTARTRWCIVLKLLWPFGARTRRWQQMTATRQTAHSCRRGDVKNAQHMKWITNVQWMANVVIHVNIAAIILYICLWHFKHALCKRLRALHCSQHINRYLKIYIFDLRCTKKTGYASLYNRFSIDMVFHLSYTVRKSADKTCKCQIVMCTKNTKCGVHFIAACHNHSCAPIGAKFCGFTAAVVFN